jgi:hypothetical protein
MVQATSGVTETVFVLPQAPIPPQPGPHDAAIAIAARVIGTSSKFRIDFASSLDGGRPLHCPFRISAEPSPLRRPASRDARAPWLRESRAIVRRSTGKPRSRMTFRGSTELPEPAAAQRQPTSVALERLSV